jgi:hypothetical protein
MNDEERVDLLLCSHIHQAIFVLEVDWWGLHLNHIQYPKRPPSVRTVLSNSYEGEWNPVSVNFNFFYTSNRNPIQIQNLGKPDYPEKPFLKSVRKKTNKPISSENPIL